MKSNFNKIVIVSLCDSFTCKVGKALAQSLDMLFCDCNDLLEYELVDKNALKQFCTKEYLSAAEAKVFKHLSSFENIVAGISFDHLINNFSVLKKSSLFIFLNIPKQLINVQEEKLNLLAYQSRSNQLQKLSDVTLNLEKLDLKLACEKITDALGGII